MEGYMFDEAHVEPITWTHPTKGEVTTPIFVDRTKQPVCYVTYAKRVDAGGNGFPQSDAEWIQEFEWQGHAMETLPESLGFYRMPFYTRAAYDWQVAQGYITGIEEVPIFIDEVTDQDFSEWFGEFT